MRMLRVRCVITRLRNAVDNTGVVKRSQYAPFYLGLLDVYNSVLTKMTFLYQNENRFHTVSVCKPKRTERTMSAFDLIIATGTEARQLT